jgi:hypothetical protein
MERTALRAGRRRIGSGHHRNVLDDALGEGMRCVRSSNEGDSTGRRYTDDGSSLAFRQWSFFVRNGGRTEKNSHCIGLQMTERSPEIKCIGSYE